MAQPLAADLDELIGEVELEGGQSECFAEAQTTEPEGTDQLAIVAGGREQGDKCR